MAFDFKKLGVKKNIPKVSILDYNGVFSAEPKFGKTSYAAKLPQTILVSFEQGYTGMVVDYIDCTSDDGWQSFIDFIDNLTDNREEIGNDIKLIVCDSLEEMYAAVEPYMLKRESLADGKVYKTISDLPYGQGFQRKDEYFKKQIRRIYQLGFHILYLTHEQIKTIRPKDPNEQSYDIAVSSIPDRCAKIVFPETDYIMHGHRALIDGNRKRVLQLQGSDDAVAGSRVQIAGGEIIFDTEDEAVNLIQQKFKEAIQQKLKDAGIKDNIDDLAKKQDNENLTQVKQTLAENKALPNLISSVKAKMKECLSSNKITAKEIMDILSTYQITQPDSITDANMAKDILDKLQAYA